MLKIEIVQQTHVGRTPCAFCAASFDLAPLMATVVGGEAEYVYLGGYVCSDCLGGGPPGMAKLLRDRAEGSRQAAVQYDHWADESVEMPAGDYMLAFNETSEGGIH
jgi:hypothetical protein